MKRETVRLLKEVVQVEKIFFFKAVILLLLVWLEVEYWQDTQSEQHEIPVQREVNTSNNN